MSINGNSCRTSCRLRTKSKCINNAEIVSDYSGIQYRASEDFYPSGLTAEKEDLADYLSFLDLRITKIIG